MKGVNKKGLNTVLLIILITAFFPVAGQAYHEWGDGGGGSPPSPPVLNSIASPTDNVYLSWNYVATATSYKIYRCDTQSGTYSPIATTTNRYYTDNPSERGDWWYMVIAHNYYGDSGDSNKRSVFYIDGIKKIAVFFWDSDCIESKAIYGDPILPGYDDILSDKGYTHFFYYPDTTDYEQDFDTFNNFEFVDDIVFFYIGGHGRYDGDDSYTQLRDGSSEVSSSAFKSLMDGLDSNVKGIMVESCYSGGWVDDFNAPEYFAISTTDQYTTAATVLLIGGVLPDEGMFSSTFWGRINEGGYDAETAYTYACDLNEFYSTTPYGQDPYGYDYYWSYQGAMLSDNVEHNFFAD